MAPDHPTPADGHPADFWQPRPGGRVECQLCVHTCLLEPGENGRCRVRHNHDGTLLTTTYARPVAALVEPIEKKHLYHVLPGATTLSLGTAGCTMDCSFCINWQVSQRIPGGQDLLLPPVDVVELAQRHGVQVIAFTWGEPSVSFEYAEAIALLAKAAGLVVVASTNGLIAAPALERMAGWLDAVNIDLKAWRADTYDGWGGHLAAVTASLRLARSLGLWLEVATPLVVGVNDSERELAGLAGFIADELGPDTPWHLLRCYPSHRSHDLPVTGAAQLERAVAIGRRAGLGFVYCRGLATGRWQQTTCPGCGVVLVERHDRGAVSVGVEPRTSRAGVAQGCCSACGRSIPGLWGSAGRGAARGCGR